MSYDVRLVDAKGKVLPTEHFVEGGTHNIYGANECDLNITGNYWEVWRLIGFSPRDLHGKQGEGTLDALRRAFEDLGGTLPRPPTPFNDYWAPTPGNALAVVVRLWAFAKEHPEGTWEVVG